MLPESRRWKIEGIGEGQLSGTYPERQSPASFCLPAYAQTLFPTGSFQQISHSTIELLSRDPTGGVVPVCPS
jgi:hypothetical protein